MYKGETKGQERETETERERETETETQGQRDWAAAACVEVYSTPLGNQAMLMHTRWTLGLPPESQYELKDMSV